MENYFSEMQTEALGLRLRAEERSTGTVGKYLWDVRSLGTFLGCGTAIKNTVMAWKELPRAEYERLVHTAEQRGNERLALLLETICATGIRMSEVRYITTQAVRDGKAEISLKGKVRVISLPKKLRRKLA